MQIRRIGQSRVIYLASAIAIVVRMEKEKANCFRFIYLMVEVVPEILRFRLKQSYRNSNPKTLLSFLKETNVLHTLFHLFYDSFSYCCRNRCRIQWERPKGFSKEQWNILYDADSTKCCKKNPKYPNRICICCVTPKNIEEKDLDLSLLCLILNNCSNLMPNEKDAVQKIREMKNDHVSHKSSCRLSESDFLSLWQKAEININHLDSTKIYFHQRENLLNGPIDESLMQQYFVHYFNIMSEIKYVKETVDEMKSIMIDTQRQEPRNAVDKRKRQEPTKCSDVSNEEDNADDNNMFKKRKQQTLNCLNLPKGFTDDLRFKLPDTKPLDKYKEYISSNLLGSKVPTSFSVQMNYHVWTMKDLSKQPGFKEADKFICGKCCWLTISMDEFLKHVKQCEMRQKENIQVKNDYKNYVLARINVPTKDKDLSSKIEKEWQQGNINPQHSSIDVNYITTGCVEIWVKVDLLLFVNNISKFYSALDYLVNDIFQKYAVNLPLYSVEVYDIATGYVDNLTDEFSCGDCELKCNTLDNFISHKKTRCFQHVLPEKPFSSASFLSGWIPQNSGLEKFGSSPLTDDDFPVNNRCADFVESSLAEDSYQKDSSTCAEETCSNCGLSHTSGDFSGKDSAVNSEVEFKMSSEWSHSDLDMLRKNTNRLESGDIGYSSGTSIYPLHTMLYEIPKQFDSSTVPNWGVKRELYDTILRREETVALTEEGENFLRISLLLKGVTQRAVRTYFDKNLTPVCLDASLKIWYHKLLDLKMEHRINQSEWNLLFPRSPNVTDSKIFDVTLMIILLKNLTQMNPPSCGFYRLPSAFETTQAADLSRIKYYRNYLSHLDDGKVDNTFFNMAWNDITSAIERLGGQQMKLECDYMRTKPLDPTNQEIMMDIKCSNSKIRDIRKYFERIKQLYTEMKTAHELLQEKPTVLTKEMEERKISQNDTVPRTIREMDAAPHGPPGSMLVNGTEHGLHGTVPDFINGDQFSPAQSSFFWSSDFIREKKTTISTKQHRGTYYLTSNKPRKRKAFYINVVKPYERYNLDTQVQFFLPSSSQVPLEHNISQSAQTQKTHFVSPVHDIVQLQAAEEENLASHISLPENQQMPQQPQTCISSTNEPEPSPQLPTISPETSLPPAGATQCISDLSIENPNRNIINEQNPILGTNGNNLYTEQGQSDYDPTVTENILDKERTESTSEYDTMTSNSDNLSRTLDDQSNTDNNIVTPDDPEVIYSSSDPKCMPVTRMPSVPKLDAAPFTRADICDIEPVDSISDLDDGKEKENSNKPYKLGYSIFTLHHDINLTSVVGEGYCREVSDIVMMDVGRLVMCLSEQMRLLICNTDGSQVDSIHVQGQPWSVTAVNNSTVAITLRYRESIDIYDINNKLKLKSISLPGMGWSDITTINNKLVVNGDKKLLIIDHHTGEVVQTIKTDCYPCRLHGSGDGIFYCDYIKNNNNLYWYSYTDDRHHTLTLPSPPRSMTTLQDGSLYVVCGDRLLHHVSSNGKQYKTVTTKELKQIEVAFMSYNSMKTCHKICK